MPFLCGITKKKKKNCADINWQIIKMKAKETGFNRNNRSNLYRLSLCVADSENKTARVHKGRYL